MNALSLNQASGGVSYSKPRVLPQFNGSSKIVVSNKDTLKHLLKILKKNNESFKVFQKEQGVRVWKLKPALTYLAISVEPLDGKPLSDAERVSLNSAFDDWLGAHSKKELPPVKVRDRSVEKGCCNKSCKGCLPGNSKNAKLNIMA